MRKRADWPDWRRWLRTRRVGRHVATARRGISLFEAMAALSIVGLITTGALSAVGSGLRGAERARRMLEAEALSTQRIDMLDLLTDAELQSLPDTVASGRFDQFDPNLRDYSWTTTSAPYTEQPGVYAVTVNVFWPNGQYTLNTYLYRRPATTTRGG